MFGLGFWEIMIILLVAIVIIRPKDLPVFIRNLGRIYRRIMSFSRDLTDMARKIESEVRQSESRSQSVVENTSKKKPVGASSNLNTVPEDQVMETIEKSKKEKHQ